MDDRIATFAIERGAKKRVDDLRAETSPETILKQLNDLSTALEDDVATGRELALAFLRAGGLPAVIPHLLPPATSPRTCDSQTLIALTLNPKAVHRCPPPSAARHVHVPSHT